MKKSIKKSSQHRKLTLNRETITLLALPQLSNVAGGDERCSFFNPPSCDPIPIEGVG